MDWVGKMQSPFLAPEQLCIFTRDVQDISIFNRFVGDMCSGKKFKEKQDSYQFAPLLLCGQVFQHIYSLFGLLNRSYVRGSANEIDFRNETSSKFMSLFSPRWWFPIFFIFTPTWGNDPN